MAAFLVLSTIFAAIAGGALIPLMQALAERLFRQYITSSHPNPAKGNQPINRFTLNALRHPLRILWPILFVVAIPFSVLLAFSLRSFENFLFGLPSMALYLYIVGALKIGDRKQSLRSIYREHARLIADSAIRRLMYHPNEEEAAPIIQIALLSRSKFIREPALQVFGNQLETKPSDRRMALIFDPDPEELFKKNSLHGTKIDLETLSKYLQIGPLSPEKLEAQWDAIETELFLANRLLPHFPNVYCTACLCRAEKYCQLDFAWLQCPSCHDNIHLIADVKTVIGELGNSHYLRHEGQTLYLGLWDEENKKARWAEVEGIRIAKQGKWQNLDWACCALAEQFIHLPGKISVLLPAKVFDGLEANTQKLLHQMGKVEFETTDSQGF